jgi:putative SbcD/Mre11-related phosphoesterase
MRTPSNTTLPAVKHEIQPGLWLDSRLALWLADERLLVVADLHWGYAAAHRARGNLVPLWGDHELERRLDALLADYQPAEMVWLGDIVHAAEGAQAAENYLRQAAVPITLVTGNHDRRWRHEGCVTLRRGKYFLHHGDAAREVASGCLEIIGHHHPALAWNDGAGGSFKLPALVASTERLVLPAFSPWAAGTDCGALVTPNATIWAVAPQRIFAVVPPTRTSAAV